MKLHHGLVWMGLSILEAYSATAQTPTFTISNLSLGMSEQQALGVASQGFTVRRQRYTNLPGMEYVTAEKHTPGTWTHYYFNFVDGKLEAFAVQTDWTQPPQPLPKNIHDSLVQKLGTPTSGGDTSRYIPQLTRWEFDRQGHLLPDRAPLTTSCQAGESRFPGQTPIEKVDANCGVSIELHIAQSNGYCPSTVVYVINRPPYNIIANELSGQAAAAQQQQHNQANQIKSPY